MSEHSKPKNQFDEVQRVQEEQYSFPFHYVSQFRKNFRATVFDGYGLKYVSSMEFLLNYLKKESFHTLIDVGCGDGRLVRELSLEFPDKTISGFDYSERSINLAKGLNPGLNFKKINILEENLEKKVDFATLIEVFEHIPLDACNQFAKAVANLIIPGGKLIVTVPHRNLSLSDKHYQHFTSETLKKYFEPYFDTEKLIFLEKRKTAHAWLYKRLMKNKLFLLNNKNLLNWIYKNYKKRVLIATSDLDCEKLFLVLKKK
ncbi:class I SAM-dependent methyltransferase [Cytophagales bacterium LB-30]|uniref:Class I SAM-dependent methyltransferase n=1 Tax=Shiella aurantiaca TaxID=3058365 RepID=A0ABT8F3L6_9BACT|nr:class I SAM-dependent methyltransferase [Shiella aurantiaca]MDN4164864.1 class I SAM-dependent methyltransferase [Shiella aurantiaca]